MKVSINDVELFTMNEIKKQVIRNDIPREVLEDDLQRRMAYIMVHKYERCMDHLKKEWMPKLQALGVESIPLDDDAFAAVVFARPEYKDFSDTERAKGPKFDSNLDKLKADVANLKAAEVAKF